MRWNSIVVESTYHDYHSAGLQNEAFQNGGCSVTKPPKLVAVTTDVLCVALLSEPAHKCVWFFTWWFHVLCCYVVLLNMFMNWNGFTEKLEGAGMHTVLLFYSWNGYAQSVLLQQWLQNENRTLQPHVGTKPMCSSEDGIPSTFFLQICCCPT